MWRLLVWPTLQSNKIRQSVAPLDRSMLLWASDCYSRFSQPSKSASSPAGSLSLGDGLCIAVAERLNLPITGGDLYWETLDLRVKVLSFR
jgi:PIN domain nuclease of toxin-antitoxin system